MLDLCLINIQWIQANIGQFILNKGGGGIIKDTHVHLNTLVRPSVFQKLQKDIQGTHVQKFVQRSTNTTTVHVLALSEIY